MSELSEQIQQAIQESAHHMGLPDTLSEELSKMAMHSLQLMVGGDVYYLQKYHQKQARNNDIRQQWSKGDGSKEYAQYLCEQYSVSKSTFYRIINRKNNERTE